MRLKDETRLHVLNDLQVHANAIRIMIDEYRKEYREVGDYSVRIKMNNLDSIWDTINFNANELVRKLAIENKP